MRGTNKLLIRKKKTQITEAAYARMSQPYVLAVSTKSDRRNIQFLPSITENHRERTIKVINFENLLSAGKLRCSWRRGEMVAGLRGSDR